MDNNITDNLKYVKLPNELICKVNNHSTLKVYAALANRCYGDKNKCWISNKLLMEEAGINSTKTCSRAKKELKELGYLTTTNRNNKTNVYKIFIPKKNYTIVELNALSLLSAGAYRIYAYLNSLYIDEERTIKTKKILEDLKISRTKYLLPYLKELSEEEFLTCTIVNSQIRNVHICKRQHAQKEKPTCTKVKTNHTTVIILFESTDTEYPLNNNFEEEKEKKEILSKDPKDSSYSVTPFSAAAAPPAPPRGLMDAHLRKFKEQFEYVIAKNQFEELNNFNFKKFYASYKPKSGYDEALECYNNLGQVGQELVRLFIATHREYYPDDKTLLIDAVYKNKNYRAWLFHYVKKKMGLKKKKVNRKKLRAGLKPSKKEYARALQKFEKLTKQEKKPILKYAAHEFKLWNTDETRNKKALVKRFIVEAMESHILYLRFLSRTKAELRKELNDSKNYQTRIVHKTEETRDLLEIWQNLSD